MTQQQQQQQQQPPQDQLPQEQLSILQEVVAGLAVGTFVGSIVASTLLLLLTAWCLFTQPTSAVGWTLLAIVATLRYLPLPHKNSRVPEEFMAFCCRQAQQYFPTNVVVEDGSDFQPDKTYVIGLEPHSALPTAIPAAFALQSQVLPQALRGRTHGLASSICFKIPLVRHIYWWNGIRPITRSWMRRLLQHNKCVVLVPGGVQECLFMQKGSETAFLSKRKGFIRMAMQTGAAVVPCFAFGQGGTYSWLRPGPPLLSEAMVQALSRRIGMVPLLLVGRGGSCVPIKSPLTVVFGRPIEVPHLEAPPDELVQQYLTQFIDAMQQLFDKHKAAAGYPDYQLHIM